MTQQIMFSDTPPEILDGMTDVDAAATVGGFKNSSALVLLSGGLDSCTVLTWALAHFNHVEAVSLDYAQRHSYELDCAKAICVSYGVKHRIFDVPLLSLIGKSSLTDRGLKVPESESVEKMSKEIPNTYVPARNIVFLSLLTAIGQAEGINHLCIGVNALDYSGYPDCRLEFIDMFEAAINNGTKMGVEGTPFFIHTPLIEKSKAEIIKMADYYKAPLSMTMSCYNPVADVGPDGLLIAAYHCGKCDSCLLRKKGFAESGLTDVTSYV